jgi:hypothetical protein
MTLKREEYLEIATEIGCPVNCLKYCPQEVLTSKYFGEKTLSLDNWGIVLGHIPKKLPLVFSGFCEPFANTRVIDLIEMAYKAGHPLGIFTTLYQASHNDVEKLVKYPYLEFWLHLPDGEAMKVPLSQEYKDNVFTVLQNVRNLHLVIMNDLFVSNNRENATRGLYTKRKPVTYCSKLKHPQFVLLPNGDMSLCSNDFGLWHILGNLLIESYEDVRRRFLEHKRAFKLCSLCSNNSILKALAEFTEDKTKKYLFHRPIP